MTPKNIERLLKIFHQGDSSMSFTHLHLHTQYSFLSGMIRIKELMKKAKDYGMPAVAMTDTNNIFGAIDFYFAAKEQGLKPIIGCELVYSPEGKDGVFTGTSGAQLAKPLYSLVVLCKNQKGYHNLSKLLTQVYLEGAQNKTVLSDLVRGICDRELLDRYGDDLIILSGSLRGEISSYLLAKEESKAVETLQWFKKRFQNNFYLEVVDNGIPEQNAVNQRLVDLAKQYEVELVGTSDCYYLEPHEAEAHEVLQCIPLGRNLDIDRPKSLVPREFYFKSPELMREHLEAYPQAYENAQKIAEECNLDFKFKDEQGHTIYHLPNFRPEGTKKTDEFDLISYFKTQAREGLKGRFLEPAFAQKNTPEHQKVYHDRLESELDMIEKTGFASYFLIVSDFIKWAKEHSIPVGPGRGSGAGSLVAYSLFITDIDPIEFNLLFERFINPERVSMPDFDIDFCQEQRGKVIEYVANKYGKDNVSQIITFGKLQAKACFKDVARVFGLSFSEADQVTKLFPQELNIKLKEAYEQSVDLRAKIESEPKLTQIWNYALQLEGLYRNAGMHAAGVIITEEPIVSYCPLYVSKEGDVVTQFDKDFSEKIGLIKYDFLGLKTLTVIDSAIKFIHARSPDTKNFDLKSISYRDQKVFDLISSGNTNGVFQVESEGMKDLCRRIIPNSLEDLTAINALFRPGPLGSGMVDDFIDRKHGRKQTQYELQALEPILKDTYGVILYQEQVMQIARDIAGYTLGQADMLRRAMGKKKPEEMAKHKSIFVTGAVERNIPQEKADALFDLMAKFAEYGFNKSHSAAYGVITYQTAYLKTYFPVEFMAALLTTEMADTDKLAKYVNDARSFGISVLPPDVNKSQRTFSIEYPQENFSDTFGSIRFGLEAVKGIGAAAVDTILEAREQGDFSTVLDFCTRVSMRRVNKKVLESLVMSGALDGLIHSMGAVYNRASLFASIESMIQYAAQEQEKAELGQTSLFENFKAEEIKLSTPLDQVIKVSPEWTLAQTLLNEKSVLGFFISGHPMQNWQKICLDWLGTSSEVLAQNAKLPQKPQVAGDWSQGKRPQRKEVKMAGIVGQFKEITTKKGLKMAFFDLEDLHGKVEVVAFSDFYLAHLELIERVKNSPEAILITGEFDVKEGEPKILAQKIEILDSAHQSREVMLVVNLNLEQVKPEQMRLFKQQILKHRGKSAVRLNFRGQSQGQTWRGRMDLPKPLQVQATPQFAAVTNQIFGGIVAVLQ